MTSKRNLLSRPLSAMIAVIAGFGLAFLTAGIHSLFFVLLPILAFAFGYFSSWRWGLLYGFLLFACYTFAISVIWWGIDSPNLIYPFPTGARQSILLTASRTPIPSA